MPALETYEQAVEWLYGRIDYERAPAGSYTTRSFKLDRMRRLLELVGNPHLQIPAVHIAGTKGKGSTAAMVAEILGTAGYKTGLFTSPHIAVFEERFTVNGAPPGRRHLVRLVQRISESVAKMDAEPGRMKPTFFEIVTALAWLFFAEQQVQIAVLEVGLGGRLDATNICRPEVCVITNISFDHTALLGNTLSSIAREKAGIVKPEIPVVSGCTDEESRTVIESVCREKNAAIWLLDREIQLTYHPQSEPIGGSKGAQTSIRGRADLKVPDAEWFDLAVPLPGAHQAANAALAVSAVEILRRRGWRIAADAISSGLSNARCPLRIEVIAERPTVVVDAAHNSASMTALLATLDASFRARRRILVFGATRDKDVAGMLKQAMSQFDSVILTAYEGNPRALSVEETVDVAKAVSCFPIQIAANPRDAWKLATDMANQDDLICATGSFFLAAEVREIVLAGQSSSATNPRDDEAHRLGV